MYSARLREGFTIVELLIVIVVIAILATVTTVAFNGMQQRAVKTLVKDGLSKVSKQLEYDKVTRGSYATQLSDVNANNINNLSYQYTSTGEEYCLTASSGAVSMFKNSGEETANGVCSGHSDPNAPPPVIEIVASPLADASIPGQTTPVSQSVAIPGELSPSDTVFVVYNLDFYSHVHGVSAGGTQFEKVYRKTMGASGYQQTVAYMATGLSGSQTLQTLGCYGGNSTTACYAGANFKAEYMIFVIKGKSGPLTVTATDTSYGSQSANATVAPSATSITPGDVAFFVYTYYGNYMPTISDASSPASTWTAGSTRSKSTARPDVGGDTALGVYHSVAQSGGTIGQSLTMPSSGTITAGATLFVVK
jgi:prepilin-type N-terminal cleavage/methylation domain-containing protein